MNHVIILINNRTTPAPLPKAPPRQSPPPTTPAKPMATYRQLFYWNPYRFPLLKPFLLKSFQKILYWQVSLLKCLQKPLDWKLFYWNLYKNLSSERFSIEILAELFAWKFFYWNQCRHVSVESCSIEILTETSLLKIFLLKSLQKRLFGRIFYWNPSKNLSYSNLCPESVSIEILTEIGSFYWNHYKNVSSERISIEILAEPFFWKLFRWNP